MRHFFLWCAGASPLLLKQCKEGEAIRQNIIGMCVALTGIFALLTSFHAFHSISQRIDLAITGSVLWAAMIFTIDRFIVSSMKVVRKGQNEYRIPFVQIVPRLVLAVAIGLSVGVPLELFLFRAEIAHHLQQVYHSKKISEAGRRDQVAEDLHARITQECDQQHGADIKHLTRMVERLDSDIAESTLGRDYTGRPSCGRHCNDLKNQQVTLAQRLSVAMEKKRACLAGTGTPAGAKRTDLLVEGERWRRYETSYEDEALLRPTFLRQYQALQAISAGAGQGQPGEVGDQVGSAALFIPLLLVFLEIVPVITKFMGGVSTYDLLAMQERLAAIESTESDSIASATRLARQRLDHERMRALAEHEAATYGEIHHTAHDAFKSAVIERLEQRLRQWQGSQPRSEDIGHLDAGFSDVLRQRFAAVVHGACEAARTAVAEPERATFQAPRPAPAAGAVSVPAAVAAPEATTAAANHEHAGAFWSRLLPHLQPFKVRFLETAGAKAAEALAHLFANWPAVPATVPVTVFGVLSATSRAAEPMWVLSLALVAFQACRFWALRRRQPAAAT